ncbi:MAG: hypothetical protein HC913_20045 [Microscillaceae bacterium]|nr:hypothetical protein [Microscillaceae bacterium]
MIEKLTDEAGIGQDSILDALGIIDTFGDFPVFCDISSSMILRSVMSCETSSTDSRERWSLYSGIALTCMMRSPMMEGKSMSTLIFWF